MAALKKIPRPVPANWNIRPLAGADADRAALLRLNAASYPSVHTLDAATLGWLLAFGGGRHLVAVDEAGAMLGYLLSFASASDYDDSEIRELRRRVPEPFCYVCQVVVAPAHRGRGMARAFYTAAGSIARSQGVRLICCDVNTNPPNPDSFAFHRCLGFSEIGRGTASNGFGIAFLAKKI